MTARPSKEVKEAPVRIIKPKPTEIVKFSGEYPGTKEFQEPWEYCVQVPAGLGKVSLNGKPLESAGFSFCSGFTLHSLDTLEVAAFHVQDLGLNYDQREIVRSMSHGDYIAVFSFGKLSRRYINTVITDRVIRDEGVRVEKIYCLDFPNGSKRWDFVVKPKEVLINLKNARQLYKYKIS